MKVNTDILEQAAESIQTTWPEASPEIGLIFGSGWSPVADAFQVKDSISYDSIPGMGKAGVEGHAGKLLLCEIEGKEILVFQGRRHLYEGEGWTPVALPVFLMKKFGVKTVLLTNAAGGINAEFSPGTIMVIRDHINLMGSNPLVGLNYPEFFKRFVDQSTLYTPELRELLHNTAKEQGEKLEEGVYVAQSGPAYETPAEIAACRSMGADAAGMSTIPEAILANSAGMQVVAISCISNAAAGLNSEPLSHEEVVETLDRAMGRLKRVIPAFCKALVYFSKGSPGGKINT